MRLGEDAISELAHEVAGLPSELDAEGEEAKRFDLLMLKLQLAVLRTEPSFTRLSDQVKTIASLLEEKSSIPMVQQQLALILDLQCDEWWQDVTPQMLEQVRTRLRLLVKLIDKKSRKHVYTDFEDEMGAETSVGEAADVQKAKTEKQGLGLSVRSLVGLDREAAKHAFASFYSDVTLTASQLEFVNLIVDHLTEHGVMSAALLYESPFTDVTPLGPDGIFASVQVEHLVATLDRVRAMALAA